MSSTKAKPLVEEIRIRNYRLFRDTRFQNLQPLTVLVGANGSGKSTLFDVLTFLKDALAQNVAVAVSRRGGFRELRSRNANGPITIMLKLRETEGRLATYEVEIDEENGRPVVAHEVLKFRRGSKGRPWHFVDFQKGHGKAITNEADYGQDNAEEERAEYRLDDPATLAIKGLGQFKEFRIVAEFRSLIENWHISDFHIGDARPSIDDGIAEHLSQRGENVAQVARFLFEQHRTTFDQLLEKMRRRVPGISRVEAKVTEDGRLVLRFHEGAFQDPFIARYVSDGTIRMFAYLVMLMDPNPHPLLGVEEPENQLYPSLLPELLEEFREYAQRGGQVLVSTHSPELLNAAELKEIFWLRKENGYSTAHWAAEDKNLERLVKEGDRPGTLWNQGLFEGVHPR